MNEEQLKQVICDEFLGGDTSFPIDGDTRLMDEGICDSLGLVRLSAEIESITGVRILDQEITHENFGTMNTIIGFVTSKQQSEAA